MGRIICCKDSYEVPSECKRDLDVEFRINETCVSIFNGKLKIESTIELNEIDDTHEIKKYIRPDLLAIQGILSYFTGCLFTVYELNSSEMNVLDDKPICIKEVPQARLLFKGNDYSDDLNIMLNKLRKPEFRLLIITLLDRWRKALYMEFESEVNTFHDEAILTHFHILELVVEYYYDDFKSEAYGKIKKFLKSFTADTLIQSGSILENNLNSKFKLLKGILVGEEASITTKLKYFLKRYGILDDQTDALISKLVKIRNSIAHGRITYEDKLTWPLPPFFKLTNESHVVLSQISVMTARAIALHLNLGIWKNDWEEIHESLSPSDGVLLKFIKGTEHAQVSSKELLNGKFKNISVSAIMQFFIENQKKCSILELEKVLSKTILETTINEENCWQLFLASVLLCDSENQKISRIAKSNVAITHENGWYGYSNLKDVLGYFEYHGITVEWLYSWIQNGSHRTN